MRSAARQGEHRTGEDAGEAGPLTLTAAPQPVREGAGDEGRSPPPLPPEPPGGEGGESREAAPLWARAKPAQRPKGRTTLRQQSIVSTLRRSGPPEATLRAAPVAPGLNAKREGARRARPRPRPLWRPRRSPRKCQRRPSAACAPAPARSRGSGRCPSSRSAGSTGTTG